MSQLVPAKERAASIRKLLERPDVKAQIATALPRHLTADRMLRVAMTSIQSNPKLLEADQRSLLAAIIMASQLGLEPDGALGHAALIPYGSQVQFQPMYKGLLALVRRSGELSTIEARAVYARDHFKFHYGIAPVLEHEPFDPGPGAADPEQYQTADDYHRVVHPGALIAAYAIARLKDGGIQWDVMRRHEIDAIRRSSKAANSGPWVTHYDEMAKKTVLKRLCKLLPMSIEAARAIELDDKAEVGIPQDLDIPGVSEEPEATEKPRLLQQLTDAIKSDRKADVQNQIAQIERDMQKDFNREPRTVGDRPMPPPDPTPAPENIPPLAQENWTVENAKIDAEIAQREAPDLALEPPPDAPKPKRGKG